jgi:hypothetical protein
VGVLPGGGETGDSVALGRVVGACRRSLTPFWSSCVIMVQVQLRSLFRKQEEKPRTRGPAEPIADLGAVPTSGRLCRGEDRLPGHRGDCTGTTTLLSSVRARDSQTTRQMQPPGDPVRQSHAGPGGGSTTSCPHPGRRLVEMQSADAALAARSQARCGSTCVAGLHYQTVRNRRTRLWLVQTGKC